MNQENRDGSNGQTKSFQVDIFQPQDAEGITQLFRAVYGDGYPIKIFYDPDAITRANQDGDYYSIVMRDASGKIIGVQHLFRSAPFRSLYEVGVGLVYQEYRGQGIFNESGTYIVEQVIPKLGLETVFGESVCNHVHTQKMCSRLGFIDTAVEIALMPMETYSKEKASTGRVSTVLQFQSFKPNPHTVYLPQSYEKEIRLVARR